MARHHHCHRKPVWQKLPKLIKNGHAEHYRLFLLDRSSITLIKFLCQTYTQLCKLCINGYTRQMAEFLKGLCTDLSKCLLHLGVIQMPVHSKSCNNAICFLCISRTHDLSFTCIRYSDLNNPSVTSHFSAVSKIARCLTHDLWSYPRHSGAAKTNSRKNTKRRKHREIHSSLGSPIWLQSQAQVFSQYFVIHVLVNICFVFW